MNPEATVPTGSLLEQLGVPADSHGEVIAVLGDYVTRAQARELRACLAEPYWSQEDRKRALNQVLRDHSRDTDTCERAADRLASTGNIATVSLQEFFRIYLTDEDNTGVIKRLTELLADGVVPAAFGDALCRLAKESSTRHMFTEELEARLWRWGFGSVLAGVPSLAAELGSYYYHLRATACTPLAA